jgi:F-type H+-transporting ATPase subunit epsilon
MTFKFELVSPERLLVSTNVDEVIVPGSEGDFTVLANHAPFVTTLRPGVLSTSGAEGGNDGKFYVRGGFAEAGPDALTVLAEIAMPLAEVTDAVFDAQINAAREDLNNARDDETRYAATDVLERLSTLRETLRAA